MIKFLIVALLLKSFVQSLYVLYLLQLNEYRFDRFVGYLRRNHKSLVGAIPFITILAPISVKKLPKPTAKALVLIGLTILIHLWIYIYLGNFVIVILVCIALTPLLQLGVVVLVSPIEWCIRHYLYNQAQKKVSALKKQGLIVVGITGSYGKSTTKYFLSHLLSSTHNVLTTDGSINTPLALSLLILNKLRSDHQVLIAEMGAYKQGEVAELARITQPDIGIITGISDQHIELFGSQENIIKGKSELLFALPRDGAAYINDSSAVKPIVPQNGLQVTLYGTDQTKRDHATILNQARVVDFLKTNLEVAMLIALRLGVSKETILKDVITLETPPKTMQTTSGYNGSVVINDTFSSNAQGVMRAIEELSKSNRPHKVVVMTCLIELGDKAVDFHKQIGALMSQNNIACIVTTSDFFDAVKSGFSQQENCLLKTNPDEVVDWLKNNATHDSAVLLEGKIAPSIVKFMTL